jgi:superfamily II DNA/RNA helicase
MSSSRLTGRKILARSCPVEVLIIVPCLTECTDSTTDTNEDADHHYLLFSATFKPELRKIAKKYLANDHIRIRIGRAGSTHMNVKQIVSFKSTISLQFG